MNGVNKAIIVGTLGQDPEIRYTADGKAIANLSVATNEAWKGKDGNKQERTEWHRVSMFGKLAEIAGNYLKKGSQVYLQGRIQTRKWQDKNGNDRYTTEIVANEMQMLGGAKPQQQPRDYPADSGATDDKPEPQGGMVYDDIPFAPVNWRAS